MSGTSYLFQIFFLFPMVGRSFYLLEVPASVMFQWQCSGGAVCIPVGKAVFVFFFFLAE